MTGVEGAGTIPDSAVAAPDPRIAVVIVTYNSADVLEDCLTSLARSEGVQVVDVVVADNDSADGWRDIVTAIAGLPASPGMPDLPVRLGPADRHGLPVRPVELGRNAGYSAAINAGIAVMDLDTVDAVLVLNPDARVRPDTLARLAAPLGVRHPGASRIGIVAPRMLNCDGSMQPSLRRGPTITRALAEAIIGGDRAGRIAALGEMITDPARYELPGPTVWATGAALLVSSATVLELGPWDESYFLYSEETEYLLRAADHGWTVWYEPAAVVEHIGGESGTDPALFVLMTVNRIRLFRTRRGPASTCAYYVVVLLGEVMRALAGRATSRAAVAALVSPSGRRRAFGS